MIVKLKSKNLSYPDLSEDQPYFVIGIEADDYRILNDAGKPYLYPPDLFDVIDPREPQDWVTEIGDDGERYSYPPPVKKSLESTYPRPEGVALRPIHGFATAISKAFFRQSHLTLTTPKGRGFLHWIK